MLKILNKIRTSQKTGAQLFKGGAILGTGIALDNVLRLARNMILARLILPESFGTMAVALSVSELFDVITSVGVNRAVIQNPNAKEKSFLNGVFWFSFARAAIVYVAIFFTAPVIAAFYNDTSLINILRVIGISIIFRSLISPAAIIAQKEMKFKTWGTILYGGGIAGIILSLLLAIKLRTVWLLVAGLLLENGLRLLFSYFLCPFLPGFRFDKDRFKELINYTKGMFGLSILMFIFSRTDVLVLKKIISPVELGIYSMVVTLAKMPAQLGAALLDDLLMPFFSRMQDDYQGINSRLIMITKIILAVVFPFAVLCAISGKQILLYFYGSTYVSGSQSFSIMTSAQMLLLVGVPIATIYFSINKPSLQRRFSLLRAGMIIIFIYPFVYFFNGAEGAAAACLFSIVIAFLFQMISLRWLTRISLRKYIISFANPAFSSMVLTVLLIFTNQILSNKNLYSFIVELLLTAIAIFINFYYNFTHEINSYFKKGLSRA